MVVGTTSTAPATVAIKVVDPDNPTAGDAAETPKDRRTRRLFKNKESTGNNGGSDVENGNAGGQSPRRPPWSRGSTTPKPRESEFNAIEMESIYNSRNTSKEATPSTPFMENLMRKTSGSIGRKSSADEEV